MPGMPNLGQAMSMLFGGKPASTGVPPANPNQQPTNQREQQQQQVRKQAPSGEQTQLETLGGGNEGADGEQTAENPLDKYKEVWQPKRDKDGNVVAEAKRNYKVDPAKMMEAAGKLDFKKFVKPEHLEAIAKGGAEGTAAFMEAMQSVSAGTFATSMTTASNFLHNAMESQAADFEARLPDLVRKLSSKDSLRTKNPALSHPATQPVLEALQAQLAKQHPDATASELSEMSESYFTSLVEVLGGKKDGEEGASASSKRSKRGGEDQDWSAFLPQQ